MIFTLILAFAYGCQNKDNVQVTLYLGEKQVGEVIQLDKGDQLIVPCAQKEGHTLDGWYVSIDNCQTIEKKWIFTDKVQEDLSLYAFWVPDN